MKIVLVILTKIYRTCLSPLLGPRCRFYPSCSEYYLLSLKQHSAIKATWLTLKRLAKCHPGHPGGIDMPPSNTCEPHSHQIQS